MFKIDVAVRDAILALQADAVFVELDEGRLGALLERRRTGKVQDGGGYVERKLQAFQQGLAESYGTQPGAEMLAAVDAARMLGARLALIDPPLDETRRRLKQAMRWRDWLKVAGLGVAAAAKAAWPGRRRKARQMVEDEIQRYQRDPEAVLEELAKRLPAVHRVVIAERDEVMAKRIRAGLQGVRHGVAVVGDGHVPGLLRLLGDLEPVAFRLPQVREGKLPKPLVARSPPGQTGRVSFTVHVRA